MSSITRTETLTRNAPCDTPACECDREESLSVIEFELSALGAIEFELDAEELLPSRPRESNRKEPAPPRATRAASMRPWGHGAIALALIAALAVLVFGITPRKPSASTGRSEIAMSERAHKAEPSASFSTSSLSTSSFSTSAARPLPVRFANPFDAREVFEFPPGTSREYARETVAEFLIDRARERDATRARSRIRRETRDS